MFVLVRNHHGSHCTDEELMLRKIKLLAQGHTGRKWRSASCPSLSVFPFSIRTNPKRSLGIGPHFSACPGAMRYGSVQHSGPRQVRVGGVSGLGMYPLSCCSELNTVACALAAILDREGEAPRKWQSRGCKEPAPSCIYGTAAQP